MDSGRVTPLPVAFGASIAMSAAGPVLTGEEVAYHIRPLGEQERSKANWPRSSSTSSKALASLWDQGGLYSSPTMNSHSWTSGPQQSVASFPSPKGSWVHPFNSMICRSMGFRSIIRLRLEYAPPATRCDEPLATRFRLRIQTPRPDADAPG